MVNVQFDVALSGPIFSPGIDETIKRVIVDETLNKVDERIERSSKARRSKGRILVTNPKNRVTRRRQDLTLEATTTLIGRRNTGRSWVRKHLGSPGYGKGIIGAMLPRVLRKTARRLAEEMGGA